MHLKTTLGLFHWRFIFLAFIVFPLSSSFSQTKEPDCTQTIEGKALDNMGDYPLASIEIQLVDKNRELISKTITNKDGDFQFKISCDKNYLVLVDRTYYYFDRHIEYKSIKELEIAGTSENKFTHKITLMVSAAATLYMRVKAGFPWEPPKPSSLELLPDSVFSNCKNLKDVDEVLTAALDASGYADTSYFEFSPYDNITGFIMATKLERIDKKGYAFEGDDRWNKGIGTNQFSFSDYVKSLFFTKKGYYRIIVFIIADKNFETKGTASREEASKWVIDGYQRLSPYLNDVPFTEKHAVTALIYEYELTENEENAVLVKPGEVTGKDHLVRSKIWQHLMQE